MQYWLWAVIFGFLLYQLTVLAMTVYLHRGITHRGIEFHPVASVFFRTLLWLSVGIVPKEWAAVHRKHHQFTDKEGDPHSPHLLGFWRIQLFNWWDYAKNAAKKDIILKYAADIKDDWFDKYVFRFKNAGIIITTILFCLFLSWWGILAVGVNLFLIGIGTGLVNGLCHWIGYKNFNNTAFNVSLVAFFTGGEGLHNNHHAFPACPKLSMRKSEFDPAWILIKFMSWLKLCTPARTVSLNGALHKTIVERLAKES